MRVKTLRSPISLGLVLILSSFTPSAGQTPLRAGSLKAEWIGFQFAVYYLPTPNKDPMVVFRDLLANRYPNVQVVDDVPEEAGGMLVRARMFDNVQAAYRPPDEDELRHFGRGISSEQADLLQGSDQALILEYGHPAANVWTALRTSAEMTEQIARETGGLIWDEETREIFSPAEWHKRRLASWTGDAPDVSDHTTIHAYKSGEFIRAITLGMAKFGLPDIVVEEFPWSNDRSIGYLINLFAQAIAEGAVIEKKGQFDLDIRNIRNPDVRAPQLESLAPSATAIALLGLREGRWEYGDPHNRLIEITFERYPGPDVHARQDAMLSSLFGWEDAVSPVTHTDELLAASQAAKAELPALRRAFNKGLEPGEYILLKAPFSTPDGGYEWMWVEVIRWQGEEITGLLANEPFQVPGLHAGQEVTVNQQGIFDYIRRFPDGTQVGNETGKIMQRMNETQTQ